MIHGTKKQKKQKTEQEIKQQEELSNKINAKLSDFFSIRSKPFSDDQIPIYLQFTALLMQLCSDIPTIFNFRRQLLERVIKINEQQIKLKAQILVNEIKLVTKLIRQDPKSYTLWSFRQWLVQNIYLINKGIIKQEKGLCKLLLSKDQKNFHVWNYRNWVNSVQFSIDQQLLFTEQKIKSNPFNFSPYHFRSKYLPLKYLPLIDQKDVSGQIKKDVVKYGMPKQIFDSELQRIKTAIYLNPNQQAPWIYYRWLSKRLIPVIVLSYTKSGSKHTFVFNQRIKNITKLLKFTDEFNILTNTTLSSIWQFQSAGECEFSLLEKDTTIVQTQGIHKQLKTQITKDLSQYRQIFKVEEEFMKQILIQEPGCRFAWLELLQVYKNQLHLTCSSQLWNKITREGQNVFEKLDKQAKTKNYIEKLKQYWLRISNIQNLTFQENLLVREA